MRNSALIVPAWQTHMPTKQGNVPRLNPQEEQIDPKAQAKIKQDPAQLQREARELLDLSQSLQLDIESLNRGLHPKDTSEKLKRIQKLAKHLRGEIEP
jgi:Skp family chaperone for outer membrane proteins